MSSGLTAAIAAMRQRSGERTWIDANGSWQTLVATVADLGVSHDDTAALAIDESVLASPAETVASNAETLAKALGRVPRAAQKGALLRSLAQWWVKRFGDETAPDWPRDLDSLREQLRRVRGVNLEMADRILLFVAGLPAFPVDRSTMRIVCRHGWLGPESEYDEWQSLLRRAADDAVSDPRDVSRWMGQIGHDHCGPQPKCSGCPLERLLPPGGAYEPDAS